MLSKYVTLLLPSAANKSFSTLSFARNNNLYVRKFTSANTVIRKLSTMALDYVTVSYVTAPSQEVARQLAKGLVENRFAACVNIVKGVESIYEWKDKIEQEEEVLMIIKSNATKTQKLTEFVEKNHPYDCPEVVTLKADSASKNYHDWITSTINKKKN